jgi:dTDP-4-amino-4,6-dideoxygalactose transaminase
MTLKPFADPIYVTQPLLPPLAALTARLEQVWESRWLTNVGRQHEALEAALHTYLAVPELSLFNNGTIALFSAIRGLGLSGDVVTTPFTFPATPHALSWSGITPVFADIDPIRLTLDPRSVEERITPKTTGILAVHVYGVPCDVDGLQDIATRHGLRLVYDAAHAFGAQLHGRGIGTFGDATMFSFHATKLFHTAEGGAVACTDRALREQMDRLKNFGIVNQESVDSIGLNGKMNELQAALGLAVLDCMPEEIAKRRRILDTYRRLLTGVPGVTLMPGVDGAQGSHQYCVVRIDEQTFGRSRDEVHAELKKYNVHARKYFYPLCSDYSSYRNLPSANPAGLPVAQAVVRQVLCLPLYGALDPAAVETICEIVTSLRECPA